MDSKLELVLMPTDVGLQLANLPQLKHVLRADLIAVIQFALGLKMQQLAL